MKNTTRLIAFLGLILLSAPHNAWSVGRIQNEDVKSQSDITSSVLSTTGNLTLSNACISSLGSTTGLATGQYIYDTTNPTYISAGTTIAGLPGTCSAGQVQMSTTANHAATGDTITFGGQASQLINATKIWDTVNLQPLSTSIASFGGGAGGVQLLTNPGFEIGTSATGWTFTTAGQSTVTTTVYDGNQSEELSPSSQTPVMYQDVTPSPAVYSGVNMEASCHVYTTLTNVQLYARLAGSTTGTATAVPSTGTWQYVVTNFVGPSSGSMGVEVTTSGADTGNIFVDDCYVGPARNLSQVSQAQLLGTISYAAASGCSWVTSSTSYASFSANTSCSTPVVTGSATAPVTKVPEIDFPSAGPGTYYLVSRSAIMATGTGVVVSGFRFQEATSGTASSEANFANQSTNNYGSGNWSGTIQLTAPVTNAKFQFQARSINGSATTVIYDDSSTVYSATAFTIDVYYFPSQSQIALNASQTGPHDVQLRGANGTGSSNTTVARFTTIEANLGSNITYADSATLGGTFTINTPGIYTATFSTQEASASGVNIAVTVNGTALSTSPISLSYAQGLRQLSELTTTNITNGVSWTGSLNAGDILRFQTDNSGNFNNATTIATVTQVNNSSNAPILVGSVTSQSSGAERSERAIFGGSGGSISAFSACSSSPCTVYSQSGSWLSSVTRSGTGNYVLTFASGEFSSIPSCYFTANALGGSFQFCAINAVQPTSTSMTIQCRTGAGTANDDAVLVQCMGPR